MIYRLLKPLLFRLDPERAHDLTCAALRVAGQLPLVPTLLRALLAYADPILATTVAGVRFENPLGLAAGFDKQAAMIGPLGALGFGHVEVGTITPRPQPGNPQPRMFRLPEDAALINRLGFNSPGMLAAAQQLRAYRARQRSGQIAPVVGVNLGKNRDTALERATEDYLAGFVALAPLADYVTINISSPNTPGLRKLHERGALEALVGALATANRELDVPRPLFLKISPDESEAQIEEVVGVGLAAGFGGFIATNTTLVRDGLRSNVAGETGGLSGQPLAERATATARRVTALTQGRVPLIAVGGIADPDAAYARIRAGAALVQLYTGMVYSGPGIAGQIGRGLALRLRRDGFASVAEAVGVGS